MNYYEKKTKHVESFVINGTYLTLEALERIGDRKFIIEPLHGSIGYEVIIVEDADGWIEGVVSNEQD